MRPLRLVRPDLPPLDALMPDLARIWKSGQLTNFGPYGKELERRCAEYLGRPVVAVSSGTTALLFALQALEPRRGARVVIPSFTFAATAQAVLAAGLTPLFVDVDSDGTMSPRHLQQRLARERNIAAVVPVHVYGAPADVDAIAEVVGRRRIPVIYDAAHAFGARIGGRMVGSFGQAEVFSLSATKPLVAGEGGLVASNDARLLERIRTARNYGLRTANDVARPGLNGKMSEIHALIGLQNLDRLENRLARRRRLAETLRAEIERTTRFICMPQRAGAQSTFKDFTIRVPPGLEQHDVIAALHRDGIEAKIYFAPPLHRQHFFRAWRSTRLPMTDALARTVITIPFYSDMRSRELARLCDALRRAAPRHAV